MFDPRYHDVDKLIENVKPGLIAYYELNDIATLIQQTPSPASPALRKYALALWKASSHATAISAFDLADVDMLQLLHAGVSPRGMSYLIRAAKVRAWLNNRTALFPEDLQAVFPVIMMHRLFLNPSYAYRKDELLPQLVSGILNQIAAP